MHPTDKRRLFDAHQQKLYRSRVGDVESLFAAHATSLTTPFDAVLPAISSDPHVTRLVGSDFNQLESLYDGWLARRTRQAREDFTQMLKENSVLEHWGRMKKMEKREKGKLIGEEGVREDSEDEEPDAREMAEQIDLKAIHAVLRVRPRIDLLLPFLSAPADFGYWIALSTERQALPRVRPRPRGSRAVGRRLCQQPRGAQDYGPPARVRSPPAARAGFSSHLTLINSRN